MNTFRLEMLTPERVFFSAEVAGLILESADGNVEILANHAPLVVGLTDGTIKILLVDGEKICACGGGFAMVKKETTTVLCQTLEWPEEIEYNRVQRAIERNTRKMKEAKSMAEYRLGKMNLVRAFARLRTIKGGK